ncbi:MAG: serine hydrolase [bacterium]
MKKILLFLTIILLNGCLVNDPLNQPFQSISPQDINDGIPVSTPSQEGIDSLALTDIYRTAYSQKNLWSLRSLLVFRNGKLVAENYLKNDKDMHTRHLIWSCTKQIMGILAGIARDRGFIDSLDDPISDYLTTELTGHQDKSSITIRDLLTMKSGIDYENDGTDGQTSQLLQQIPENSVEFILSPPKNLSPHNRRSTSPRPKRQLRFGAD